MRLKAAARTYAHTYIYIYRERERERARERERDGHAAEQAAMINNNSYRPIVSQLSPAAINEDDDDFEPLDGPATIKAVATPLPQQQQPPEAQVVRIG